MIEIHEQWKKPLKVVLLSTLLVVFVGGWCWGLYIMFRPSKDTSVRIQNLEWYADAIQNRTTSNIKITGFELLNNSVFKLNGNVSYRNNGTIELYRIINGNNAVDYAWAIGNDSSTASTVARTNVENLFFCVTAGHGLWTLQFLNPKDYTLTKTDDRHIYDNETHRIVISLGGLELFFKQPVGADIRELKIELTDYEIDKNLVDKLKNI